MIDSTPQNIHTDYSSEGHLGHMAGMVDPTEDAMVALISSISDSLLASPSPSNPDLVEIASNISHRRLQAYTPHDPSDDTQRVLAAFLQHLPLDGKRVLLAMIKEDTTDDRLFAIATHLTTAILIPMMACGGKQPQVSPSPFRKADEECQAVLATMVTCPTRNDQQTLKYVCLRRDNHHCVVSGVWNYNTVRMLPNPDSRKPWDYTVLTPIIPFSLGEYGQGSEQEVELAKKWVTIGAMFPEIGSFVPDNINEPYNALTMLSVLHDHFGKFRFSLAPTAIPNTYKIETYGRFESTFAAKSLPQPDATGQRFVTLVSHSGELLPRPELLGIHAAIAKILDVSGKGEQIDQILWDQPDTQCLASDGSTNALSVWVALEAH